MAVAKAQVSMARTAEEQLSAEELQEWYSRLSWEKELDMQKELRLRREALLWHDPTLDDLDDQERMWEIIQMGFQQVEDVLDSINLGHYSDYFLSKGMFYGAKMRGMSRKFLETRMPAITDAHEKEQILEACATACRNEAIRLFPFRYGNPEALLCACHEGKRFLSERFHQGWFDKVYLLTAPLAEDDKLTGHQISEEDRQSFDAYAEWVAGADSTGRVYLFPQDDDSQVPPCIRNPRIHDKTVIDMAVDWPTMRSISVGLDGAMVLYDLKKDESQHALNVTTECKLSSATDFWSSLDANFRLGKMVSGLSSGQLHLLDLEVVKSVHMFPCHQTMIRRVAADWAKNEAVSCSYDGCIHISDARAAKTVRQLQGQGQWDAMDVSFDRQLALAAAKFESATALCDLRSGQVIHEYDLPGHRPNWISVDWETMTACTGGDDGKVKVWQLENGEVTQTIDCQHFLTECLDISWARGLLLTGSFDHQIKLWDMKTGALLKQFVEPKRCITRVLLQ